MPGKPVIPHPLEGTMQNYIKSAGLFVAPQMHDFIREILVEQDRDQDRFWRGFTDIVNRLGPKNKALLATRDALQGKIDQWHLKTDHRKQSVEAYEQYLREIGYIVPEIDDFEITTSNLDPEISTIAGPQLVVPISNSRFALNAANARWGSLYDALYGTDAINEDEGCERGDRYNPNRGAKVIEWSKQFLDQAVPLQDISHSEIVSFGIDHGILVAVGPSGHHNLINPKQLKGFLGDPNNPDKILLENHGLHIEIKFDRSSPVGASDPAGISDITLESALTTIMDCEDSVAAVDADDKVQAYRNWLGLIRGDLEASFERAGKTFTRKLNADREYHSVDGHRLILPGRSLMLVRNVGHLMTTPAILDANREPIGEGIMDGVVTALIGSIDVGQSGQRNNSRAGSIYIVKPKMHGPQEVAFTSELFSHIESLLNLPENTLKMGIMDEEKRTTVNLKACIFEAKSRVFFINTGFLDRTGDEIHTCMEAGPVFQKSQMKQSVWINAYEHNNVDIGLACGFSGRAQIGKGMWAMPDRMHDMLETKIEHPKSGANTAWVPSPTAATLHATHYHHADVFAVQEELRSRPAAQLHDLLSIPVSQKPNWDPEDIQFEVDNCAQGILGYVVRWINQGVGCSKVPDINNVGLMEDRATLRISSQLLANWLHHGICTHQQVRQAMEKMAAIVDQQNADDPNYIAMGPDYDHSIAFKAACDLVFEGRYQPSGYTEPILHRRRMEYKASLK